MCGRKIIIRGKKIYEKLGRATLFQIKRMRQKSQIDPSGKKLGSLQKVEFLLLLADLLKNGFSFQEGLILMERLLEKEKWAVQFLQEHLAQGRSIHSGFGKIGYGKIQTAQINLAQIHGDFTGTLNSIAKQLKDGQQQRQLFVKVLSYPCLLLLFLISLLFGMRWFLLPQLSELNNQKDKQYFAISLIEKSPRIFFIVILFFIIIFLGSTRYFKKKTAIKKNLILVKIPLFGYFYRYYLTAFFAMEWGKLFQQGLEMSHILALMSSHDNTLLMQEMSAVLRGELEAGRSVEQQLKRWDFLQIGLSGIVEQGAIRGKLGLELIIYGQKCWLILIKKIEKTIQWIQPLLFLGVAVLIVSIYAALLLPLYDGLEVIL